VDNFIAHLPSVDALSDKFFSLGKGAGFSGFDLYKNHFIHFSFGKPVKNNEIHRSPEKPCILWVIFEVREIRDKVFRDLAADYGFSFLPASWRSFFSSSSFHVLNGGIGFIGNLAVHLSFARLRTGL